MIPKEKLNPYTLALGNIRRALSLFFSEALLWNLNPESQKSRKRFMTLKNRYAGQKAVILFNGPSLLKTDFSLLKDVFTFGLNKINLLNQATNFQPSVIVAFDEMLNRQNKDFLSNSRDFLKILNYKTYKEIKKSGGDYVYLFHTRDMSFSYDPSLAVANRGSTPYIAFQIAYFMGFQEIAIVGADHNFPAVKPLSIRKNEEEDKFHFHKEYHKKGEVNQYPDKIKLDMLFRDVQEAFEQKGRKIWNATEGGKLEIFDRISLKDFLRDVNLPG